MANSATYSPEQRQTLLKLAAASVAHGLHHAEPAPVQLKDYAADLQVERATFVTLHLDGELQGCIGTLRPIRPLVVDVSRNAYAAAFEDPRGRVLKEDDIKELAIDISVLSVAEPLEFKDEADALTQVRPGIDGLIFQDGGRVGTLLPSVWEALPDKRDFFQHVKLKAGLPKSYWSPTVVIKRYTTEMFSNKG